MKDALKTITALLALALTFAWAAAQDGPRAYRSINFGDSRDAIAHKVLEDPAFIDQYGDPFTRRVATPGALSEATSNVWIKIGYNAYRLYFYFTDDQLFMVDFESKPQPASDYESWTLDHWSKLVDVIEEARGAADEVRPPQFSDLTPGAYVWTHQWNENDAGVEHRVGLHAYGGAALYTSLLEISWVPLRDIAYAEYERELDAETKDAANDF